MAWVEAPVESHLYRDARGLCGGDAPVDVGEVEGQGFLHKGGLASLCGGHQKVDMGVGGRADGHRVHIVGLQDLLGSSGVAWHLPCNQLGVHSPDPPAAQDPDAHRGHDPATSDSARRLETTRPLRISTGYKVRGSVAGNRTASPVRRLKRPLCLGHSTRQSITTPSARCAWP